MSLTNMAIEEKKDLIEEDTQEKINLLGLSTKELEELIAGIGQPPYRTKQLVRWIYQRGVHSFDEMTDLPKAFRQELSEVALIGRSKELARKVSEDGTTKFLLKLKDGERIETVLLPSEDRVSVCVSTQVGCPVGCLFCATGQSGFKRSLEPGEIVDQVLVAQEAGGRRVTHIVFMGMGEPLLNYNSTLKAVHLLNQEVGIGMRNLTISTVGITPAIQRLAEEKLQLTLAVSLHTADEKLRHELIPVSRRFPLTELAQACNDYAELTGRRITFEVALIKGVTDTIEQAEKVGDLLRGRLCAVNLIPYNPAGSQDKFERPSKERIDAYRHVLETRGIEVTQRFERGGEIQAACGQLRRKMEPRSRKGWARSAPKKA